MITNHHCAYGAIQYNSSKEKNLLKDGFLAENFKDELPATPGSRVYVTADIQDVTSQVLSGLKNVSGKARYDSIDQRKKSLVASCEKQNGYRCRLDSFMGSSSYRLTKQMEIKDVRLVQAPPSMIGKFGGDVDNWMWPRHTGDFAFYRAYVGKDGKPAAYSKDNIPYEPKSYLKVDSEGVKDGSFVMVLGYPGWTNRHRLASEVGFTFNELTPKVKVGLDEQIALIEAEAKLRPEVGIAYAGRLASMNNYSKNIEGKKQGYEALNLLKMKQGQEKNYVQYLNLNKDDKGLKTYRELNELIAKESQARLEGLDLRRAGNSALLKLAKRLYRLSVEQEKSDEKRERGYQDRDLERFKSRLKAMSRRYDQKMDLMLWNKGLGDVENKKNIEPDLQALLNVPKKKRILRLEEFYKASKLNQESYRLGLMKASRKVLESSNDPFIQIAVASFSGDMKRELESKNRRGDFQRLRSDYMNSYKAFVKSNGAVLYSDANSTLRISYGTVQGYKNRKGESHSAFTVLEGITAKHSGKEPFNVPAKQLDLIKKKNYGKYVHKILKSVPVNFLADLDITGGNSGSATLNAKGELTGLVFDGTIDGVISDWAFDPNYTRSIHVDVRYILWILDKYDHGENLLRELGQSKLTSH